MISLALHIDAYLRGRKQHPRLRISQAGEECVRKMYYQATGAPRLEERGEGLVKMALGSAFDEFAMKNGDGWRVQVPVTIRAGLLEFTGTADAVYGTEQVSDLKVVGTSTFNRTCSYGPEPKHRAQVNMYAYGLNIPKWSVCYVHADTGAMREHFGEMDAFQAEEDLGDFELAHYYRSIGQTPPRPYADLIKEDKEGKPLLVVARNERPCCWCDYQVHCWEKDTGETNAEVKCDAGERTLPQAL